MRSPDGQKDRLVRKSQGGEEKAMAEWKSRGASECQDRHAAERRLRETGRSQSSEGRCSSCNVGVRRESRPYVSEETMNHRQYTLGWAYKKDKYDGF